MRCPQCNVDLGERAQACPLCGAAAQHVPAVIPGMQTADYPLVQYRKHPKNYAAIYWAVSAVLCLLCGIAEFMLAGSLAVTRLLAAGLSCLWFAVLWPLCRKKLPIGRYLFTNLCLLSLQLLCLTKAAQIPPGIAILFSVTSLLYLGVILLKRGRREHNAVFLLCMAAAEIALLVFVLVKMSAPWLPALALALTALDLSLVFALSGKPALAELKAFFHA